MVLAHASTAFRLSGDKRTPIIGVMPVAGRPRFFCLADIDRFINLCLA
jgi:hypothetical protein